ncbi:folate-sensitive fragile site protein Fra10Ac1-domain-containing protein, partial [Lipomyces japonicus]|uniref:folate-sensitive fragile site protein Fra10Ac1-domain-containing protein n=1 Tax=Lipomyces japonicus TaxID=56871 RepID=UPI0034CD617D
LVTERELLERHHRLIWDNESSEKNDSSAKFENDSGANDDAEINEEQPISLTTEEREERTRKYGNEIARKYANKLVKDFPLLNLSRYRHGLVGLRWRTMREFQTNKGGPNGICASVTCHVKDKRYKPNDHNNSLLGEEETESLEKRQVLFRYSEKNDEGELEPKAIMASCWLCPHHGRRLDKAYYYEKRLK